MVLVSVLPLVVKEFLSQKTLHRLANTGAINFYMTAFDCKVTNVSPLATPIAPPRDAVWCLPGNATCKLTTGAKRPLYAYK